MSHTPTPWHVSASTILSSNQPVAEADEFEDIGQDIANALHIVKCVNNHDALVRLCRDLLDDLDEQPTDSALVDRDRRLLATLA